MLRQKLDELFRMVAGGADQPPVPDHVVISETHEWDSDGNPIIAQLLPAPDYEERFTKLMGKGLAWLNMNYFGLLDGCALVLIELPRYGGSSRTSVNFSGPPKKVAASGWNARPHVIIL